MVFLFPKIRGVPVYVDYWLLPRRECDRWGTRVFGQWSRHWTLANILSDPMQIQCTLTLCGKACELPFCVEKDFTSMLLDGRIACKDILILHEPTFCVKQGLHFIWLMVTLPVRIFYSFLNCPFVLSKISLWSWVMIALPEKELEPFMNCPFASSKTSLRSCLIVTLPANIFESFMY